MGRAACRRACGDDAVAYLNVDSAASGSTFTATAVPALNQLIAEAAADVRDPVARYSDRRRLLASAVPVNEARCRAGSSESLVDNRLGSGSDYTVFLNHLGVPVADMTFDGPYGVYHSLYDTHRWVAAIGDPGFRYHTALVQLWGTIVLRLANADALPLDYAPYAMRIQSFVEELERRRDALAWPAAT